MDRIDMRVNLCCAAAILALHATVAGAQPPRAQAIQLSREIAQSTDASCGTIALEGIEDGESYMLWVKGRTSGFCSFQGAGLTFRYPPNYGPTTPDRGTLFSFTRFGAEVLVSWASGY